MKSFSIVYDKDMKQYAKDLERFVSCMDGVKCMTFQNGKVPENVNDIDKSYVVYIGSNCSKDLQYENKFNKYGIQIGWYGTNAWIRLKKEGDDSFSEWLNQGDPSFIADNDKEIANNALIYKEFCASYYKLYKEFHIRRDADIDKSATESKAISKMAKDFQFIRMKRIDIVAFPWAFVKSLLGDSKAYRRVNTFAVMYFYKNCLKSFLNERKSDSLGDE